MRFVDTLFLRFISPEDQRQVNVSDSCRRRWPADGVQANIRFVLSKFKVGVRWGEVVLAKHECVWYVGSLCFVGTWHSTTWLHRLVRYVDEAGTVRWYVETARGTVRRYVGTVRGQVGTIPGTVCWHLDHVMFCIHWYFGITHASLRGLPTANDLSIIMFAGDGRNETHVARQVGWLPIPVQPELAPCK